MADTLADIEALALRCRTERAREFIGEAVLCYKAGAYRSTIVNTWIAVVFDLIDKIRELALAGDQVAQGITTRYEAYLAQIDAGNDQGVKSALEFERTVLNTCRQQFQFFNHQQIRDLERLREDRHQCAHPSFQRPGEPFRPVAEHARMHLRAAVEHVLSQPPVQGRAAIASVLAVVDSQYFPHDRTLAGAALRGTAAGHGSEALIRGVVDALIFGFADPQHTLHGKPQVGAALLALMDRHRGVTEARLSQQLSKLVRDARDANLSLVASLIAATTESVHLVDTAAAVRLAEFVRLGPVGDVLKVLATFSTRAEIAQAVGDRVSALTLDELADGIAHHSLAPLAKERALSLLSGAGSWNAANAAFTRLVMPIFQQLSRADVERIIRMPTETRADLLGASGFTRFLEEVRRQQLVPGEELDALLRANGAGYLLRD